MKKTILILAITLIVSGCKSDTNQAKDQNQPESVEEVKEEKKEFIVDLSFKTNKSGVFQMVLYNIKVDDFQNKYIVISENIEATSSADYMKANFQENISNSFRINFGNKEIREIEVLSIELSYGLNKINIDSENISSYFDFNEYIKQDPITKLLKTEKIEGKLNPIIYLKPQFLRELKNEN